MAQSLANVVVHLVFSTKERRPLLRDDARSNLHAYVTGILRNHDSSLIEINSVEDHTHVLYAQSKNHALAKVIEEIKTHSSLWLKKQGEWYHDFAWQRGYGAFSVSQVHVEKVQRYVRDQHEHHRKVSFQDEFRQICRKNGAAFDERYAWD